MPKGDGDYLYHYTTPQGLIGIVETKTIWATNALYLNDMTEFRYGMRLIVKHLRHLRDHAERDSSWFDEMIPMVKEFTRTEDYTLYVCSFSSEKPDDLAQWRAYCPTGGFAIGFPKNGLRQLAEKYRYGFENCVYERKEQDKKIKDVLGSLPKNLWPPQIHGRHMPMAQRSVVLFLLTRTAAQLKHKAFISENEWRITCFRQGGDVEGQLCFRSKNAVIIPYIRCSLKSEDLWKEVRIVVGPASDPEASRASVKQLLRAKCPAATGAIITLSSVPYRP